MRKFLFVILVLAVVQNWGRITSAFGPAQKAAAYTGEKVVMYGTGWCGYCTKARALFAANGISYYEYDIEKSSDGRKQYAALGGKGVPLIVIDGKIINGYNERQIMAALVSE